MKNNIPPRPDSIRFPVEPRLVPAQKAARRLHLTEAEFKGKLDDLLRAGFPPACSITGHYDLKAIDAWLDRRVGADESGRPQPATPETIMQRLERWKRETDTPPGTSERTTSEKPLGLNEKRGLSGYYAKRTGPPTSVHGCGPGTIGKLLTRGYIEMVGEQLHTCKITPEGCAAWLAIADREGVDF